MNYTKNLVILITMIRVQNGYELFYSHSNVSRVWKVLDSSLVGKMFTMSSYRKSIIMWLA